MKNNSAEISSEIDTVLEDWERRAENYGEDHFVYGEKYMTKYIKIFAAVVSVAILGGCAHHESAKVSASVDQDFVNVYDAFEMAKTPRAKVTSSDTVSMSEGVWLGDKSMLVEHKNDLPSQYETDAGVTILLNEPVTLQVLANDINSITHIPIKSQSK